MPDETAASDGYGLLQRKRKLIEQGFGWAKFVGPICEVMVRGIEKVDQLFVMTMAAYNLVRMWTLGEVRPVAGSERKSSLEMPRDGLKCTCLGTHRRENVVAASGVTQRAIGERCFSSLLCPMQG